MDDRELPSPERIGPDDASPSEPSHSAARGLLTWSLAHLRPWLVVGVALLLGLGAWEELRAIDFRELRSALGALSPVGIAGALALSLANVFGMGAYEVVSLGEPWDRPPARVRWRIGSLAFALSNLMATGPLAGPALRLWLYRDHDVPARRIAGALLKALTGLWGGLAVSLGVLAAVPGLSLPGAFGATMLAALVVGLLLERCPLPERIRTGWGFGRARWTALFAIGVLDWTLCTAVFLTVLAAAGVPTEDPERTALLFLAGHAVGALSMLPGGLGTADAFWLWAIGTSRTAAPLAAAVLVYRFVYYLVPWLISCFVLFTSWTARQARILRMVRVVASAMVAASGLVALLSAATPAVTSRLEWIGDWLPLGVLEASHAAAVLSGLGLVVLARGLRRGYREAMGVTLFLLVGGAVANVAKGGDWEEALVLALTAAFIARHPRAFARPGRLWPLLDSSLAARALGLALAFTVAAAWAHAERPGWGRSLREIAVSAEAARSARAAGLLFLAAAVVGLAAVLRPSPRRPTEREIDEAIRRIRSSPEAGANALMVANGDKLVWTLGERALVLYGTIGNRLVVFGDPVAPAGAETQVLEAFLDFTDDEGWEVAFYQISPRWIPPLHDQGFTLFKLGEEAIIDLEHFRLEGKRFKPLRNTRHQIERSGIVLRILEPSEVARRIAELRAVSDAWLETRHVAEKRFSVGFFHEPYLCRFPCAVAERANEGILAFASLLPGPAGGEASIDLMRYRPGAPDGVMDALLLAVFDWAKAAGYRRFNLGMAPLATVGESRRAPLWERAVRVVYRRGEYFYNFRGLRQYKDKFHPTWEPRYLAYRRAWEWPRVMGEVTALIAGGWTRVILPGRGRRRSAGFSAAPAAAPLPGRVSGTAP